MEVDTAESPKKKKKKKKAAEAEAEEPVEEAAEVRFDSEGVLQNCTNVRTKIVQKYFQTETPKKKKKKKKASE